MCRSCPDVLKTHSMISTAQRSCALGTTSPSFAYTSCFICSKTSVDKPVNEPVRDCLHVERKREDTVSCLTESGQGNIFDGCGLLGPSTDGFEIEQDEVLVFPTITTLTLQQDRVNHNLAKVESELLRCRIVAVTSFSSNNREEVFYTVLIQKSSQYKFCLMIVAKVIPQDLNASNGLQPS